MRQLWNLRGGVLGLLVIFFTGCVDSEINKDTNNMVDTKYVVVIQTTEGDITAELFPEQAPISVQNFRQYMDDGFYEGTVFHRVVKNFVIQGGGFDEAFTKKKTKLPIVNEASNGLPNIEGSMAMARTSNPDSATSQFFINLKRNDFLDAATDKPGYAVFGQVIEGMDVVNRIAESKVDTKHGMQNVPVADVVIESVVEAKK